MNKTELSALVAEILKDMAPEPPVKGSDYKPTAPQPRPQKVEHTSGDFVPDVTALDLRKLYMTEEPKDPQKYRKLKEKTPARLGMGTMAGDRVLRRPAERALQAAAGAVRL